MRTCASYGLSGGSPGQTDHLRNHDYRGHDHLQALHTVERGVHGLVISTASTISNRLRPGRASSFNLVNIEERTLHLLSRRGGEAERREAPGRIG